MVAYVHRRLGSFRQAREPQRRRRRPVSPSRRRWLSARAGFATPPAHGLPTRPALQNRPRRTSPKPHARSGPRLPRSPAATPRLEAETNERRHGGGNHDREFPTDLAVPFDGVALPQRVVERPFRRRDARLLREPILDDAAVPPLPPVALFRVENLARQLSISVNEVQLPHAFPMLTAANMRPLVRRREARTLQRWPAPKSREAEISKRLRSITNSAWPRWLGGISSSNSRSNSGDSGSVPCRRSHATVLACPSSLIRYSRPTTRHGSAGRIPAAAPSACAPDAKLAPDPRLLSSGRNASC